MEDSRQKMAGSTPLQKGSQEFEDENGSSSMRTAETVLRLLPMGLCVVALVIMLKNSQTNDFGSLSYSDLGTFRYLVHANGICAGYSLLSAIVATVPRPITVSRAWTFFLLDQEWQMGRTGRDRCMRVETGNAEMDRNSYLIQVENGLTGRRGFLNMVTFWENSSFSNARNSNLSPCKYILTYIILAAGAASTEVVYLAYKGDTAVTWSESCGSFGGFCHKATASVSVTFIVSLCYAGLSLLSSYRLFSKYDAPVELYNNKGGIEVATY